MTSDDAFYRAVGKATFQSNYNYRTLAQRLAAVLAKLELVEMDDGKRCPSCYASEEWMRHYDQCELTAALAEAREAGLLT